MNKNRLNESENAFAAFGLIEPLVRALTTSGYTNPTEIQSQVIPDLLNGRDLIGCAQTGTGKTAAFALPLLQHLYKTPKPLTSKGARILVLSPTRELANQLHQAFGDYGRYLNLRRATVFGGVPSRTQIKTMARGVDVLVATPGRLLDLFRQNQISLEHVEALVLDEADRMLDMGFIHDIRKIAAACPAERQTLMFSATMAPPIAKLAKALLRDPLRVDVAPQSSTADTVAQNILFVDRPAKFATLLDMLQNGGRFGSLYKTLVFTRTKHGANKLQAQLHKKGVKALAIHGNKSQNQRKKALQAFQNDYLQVLVATDVAARGLDIDDVTHVVNYDMPTEPDSYVHRIGRTGRAGTEGIAISLCDSSERGLLRDIERVIGQRLAGDGQHLTGDGATDKNTQRPKSSTAGKKAAGKNTKSKHHEDNKTASKKPKRRRQRQRKNGLGGHQPQMRAA